MFSSGKKITLKNFLIWLEIFITQNQIFYENKIPDKEMEYIEEEYN